jgi:hypothetical protein
MSRVVPRRITKEEVDSLKEKIKLLYKNYGIDIDEMSEEEMSRVLTQYLDGLSDIEEDYSDSSRHSDRFSEDDLI